MSTMLRGQIVTFTAPNYVITQNDVDELVSLSEAHGIDPNDVAVVLYTESAGFNPASLGPGGTGAYTGLNQMSVANLASYGIAPVDWVTWSAAQQLPTIFKFWSGLGVSFNGGHFPQNAEVLTALNFVPNLYKTSGAASNPNAPIVSNPDIYYTKNTYYDPSGAGYISLNTIGQRVAMTKASTASRWKHLEAMIAGLIPGPPAPSPSPPLPSMPTNSFVTAATVIAGGLAMGGAAHLLLPKTSMRRQRRRRA